MGTGTSKTATSLCRTLYNILPFAVLNPIGKINFPLYVYKVHKSNPVSNNYNCIEQITDGGPGAMLWNLISY